MAATKRRTTDYLRCVAIRSNNYFNRKSLKFCVHVSVVVINYHRSFIKIGPQLAELLAIENSRYAN